MSHYAKTLLDASDTDAHVSSSQAECERSAGNLRPSGQLRMCPVMFDGWLCWPPTLAGSVIKQPCPAIYQFNVNQFAYRKCMPNGTWYGVADASRPDDTGWSNYTMCVLQSSGNGAIFPPPGSYDVTSAGYDATQPGSHDDVAGSFVSLPTSPVTQSFHGMDAGDMPPVDDVIGSVLHGVSAVCLLLAIVTWVTLKLTDRLVTRRYLVLMATIIVASLFHTIVLTSRLRALAVALGRTSTDAPSTTPATYLLPLPTTFRPPGLGYDPASAAGGEANTLNAGDDNFRFYDPYAYAAPPAGNQFKMSASKQGNRKRGRPWDEGNYDRDLDDISSQMFLKTISKRSRDNNNNNNGGVKEKNHHRDPSHRKHGDSGSKKGRNSRKGRKKSKKGGNKNKKEAHVDNRGKANNKRDDGDDDVGGAGVAVPGSGVVEEDQRVYDVGMGLGGVEGLDGMGGEEGGGSRKRVGGPWVTLCQVGRAFYLLTDMSTYSFLLAVSLYYTLVVLASDLTFNRLVAMFVLGLATPVLFVTLTILLYTFLAGEVLHQRRSSGVVGGGGFGSSCTVDALGDEFHWAVTGPKLICVVLSMCLMTVSTYGFWRLHVPALNASSETFYARQGVLKTLALLLCCSLAELLWMVTEYQKIYGWTTSRYLLYASTAAQGVKGTLLAFLFCFVDSEVLHGTCCPPSNSDGEPWLTAGTTRDEEGGRGEKYGGGDGRDGVGGGKDVSNGGGGGVGNNAEQGDTPQWGHNRGKSHRDVIGSVDFNEKM